MPKKKQESKRGIPRRAGKRSTKIAVYYKYRYPRNKLRRILKHNGEKAARKWAREHAAEGILISLLR